MSVQLSDRHNLGAAPTRCCIFPMSCSTLDRFVMPQVEDSTAEQLAVGDEDMDETSARLVVTALREVWRLSAALVAIYSVTLAIFPGVLAEDVKSQELGDWCGTTLRMKTIVYQSSAIVASSAASTSPQSQRARGVHDQHGSRSRQHLWGKALAAVLPFLGQGSTSTECNGARAWPVDISLQHTCSSFE